MAFYLKTWTALRNISIQIAKRGTSALASSLFGAVNGLYESVTGRGCPGSSQLYEGHDHTDFAGGAIMPRGLVFGFDNGDHHTTIDIHLAWIEKWAKTDSDGNWTYQEGRLVERSQADFYAYITPGIDDTKLNDAGATVTLEADANVFVYNNSGLTTGIGVRVVNVENDVSDEALFNVTNGTKVVESISFDGISAGSGGWQGYRIETYSDTGSTPALHVYLILSSFHLYETRIKTQPASAGSYAFDASAVQERP